MIRLQTGLALLLVGVGSMVARGEAGYDGGFFITDGADPPASEIRLKGRLQTRFVYEWSGDGGSDDDTIHFIVPRARLGADGHLLSKDLKYKLQVDFGKGAVTLKDYYVDLALAESIRLRVGQYKKPLSRQQITSSGKLALVDRASTDKAFGAGRDIGLMVHNDYSKVAGFEWALGFFNGAGDNVTPDQWQPIGVVRIGYASQGFGKDRYSEGDLQCATDAERCGLRWAVAASAEADASMPDDGDEGQVISELDLIVKVSGVTVTGAFFIDFDLGARADGGGLDKLGAYAQLSYLVAGPMLLPALRFATIIPDDETVATRREVTFGVGWLPHAHDIKWQTDATMAMSELAGDTRTDWSIRSQLQVAF